MLLFVVSERQFGKLTNEDQATVRRIMGGVVGAVDRQNRADHVATYQVLIDRGVERLEPSVEERAEWQRVADIAAQAWVDDGIVSGPLYDRFKTVLGEVRSQAHVGSDG